METDVRMLRSSSTRAIVGIDASWHVSPRHEPGIFATKPARGGETVTTIAAKLRDPLRTMTIFHRLGRPSALGLPSLFPIVLGQLSRAAVYVPATEARA